MSNLLSILAASTGRTPEAAAEGYTQYGPLKNDTADAVVELLAPIRARHAELAADPAEVHRILDDGRRAGPQDRGDHPRPGPRGGRAAAASMTQPAADGAVDEGARA